MPEHATEPRALVFDLTAAHLNMDNYQDELHYLLEYNRVRALHGVAPLQGITSDGHPFTFALVILASCAPEPVAQGTPDPASEAP